MSETIVEKTVKNGASNDTRARSAYISAPNYVDTSAVRKVLEGKGVAVFSPDELDLPGQSMSQIVREAMQRADMVVAVVDPTSASNFVFYEIGFAQAMAKPTFLLLLGDVSPSGLLSSGLPYVRFDPEKPTGLEFGISQMLSVPHHGTKPLPSPPKRTHPLGLRAEQLLAQLRVVADTINAVDFEATIASAIQESGVTTVAQGSRELRYVDLAVWSDDLSPWVGNPLAIELKLRIRNSMELNTAVGQLAQAMARSNMNWGLLIYLRSQIDVANAVAMPNIIAISAEQFLEGLRELSFGELIRQLRNRRVHGGL